MFWHPLCKESYFDSDDVNDNYFDSDNVNDNCDNNKFDDDNNIIIMIIIMTFNIIISLKW